MLRWVFLDVGNVLMNDDPAMAFLYSELHRALCMAGYRIGYQELLSEREDVIRSRGAEHWGILGRKYLGEEGAWRLMRSTSSRMRSDYMACHAVVPGMEELVRALSDRYAVGVIANQLKEVGDALDALEIGRLIRLRVISEAVGIRKPDPEIYRWALRRAECAPGEAVMVGDRVDNDIVPARAVGMWTILFRMAHEAKGYVPRDEAERLYFESQQRASIGRIPPSRPTETPDAVAHDVESLRAAIELVRALAESASEDPPSSR